MSPERLASFAAYAGERLHPCGPSGPRPFGPDSPVRAHNAVYIVCGWSGCVLYVGSTTAGIQTRFTQHLADVAKTLDWTTVYVIPLKDNTSVAEVRRIEGRIGLALGPARNGALPRIR